MNNKHIYEKYHSSRNLQKRIINRNNFTYKNILNLIIIYFKKSKSILDIGCGVGTLAFFLANNNAKVIGIDISKKAITIAKANARFFGLEKRINFFESNFPSAHVRGKYNGILILEVLEHLKDDRSAVKAIYRLSNKETRVIASSPSLNAPLYRLGMLKYFDKEVGHLRRYDEVSFRKLFEENGFRVVKLVKAEGVLRNFLFTNNLAGKLLRFIRGPIVDLVTFFDDISRILFGESQLILVAKKK